MAEYTTNSLFSGDDSTEMLALENKMVEENNNVEVEFNHPSNFW